MSTQFNASFDSQLWKRDKLINQPQEEKNHDVKKDEYKKKMQ